MLRWPTILPLPRPVGRRVIGEEQEFIATVGAQLDLGASREERLQTLFGCPCLPDLLDGRPDDDLFDDCAVGGVFVHDFTLVRYRREFCSV